MDGDFSHESKSLAPWKNSYDKPSSVLKNQRNHFANKNPYSQNYGFSSSHVGMWELEQKKGWAPKNWFFPIVVLLEDSWESSGLQGDQASQS